MSVFKQFDILYYISLLSADHRSAIIGAPQLVGTDAHFLDARSHLGNDACALNLHNIVLGVVVY